MTRFGDAWATADASFIGESSPLMISNSPTSA